MKLTDSTFDDNSAVGRGGAVSLTRHRGASSRRTVVAIIGERGPSFGGGDLHPGQRDDQGVDLRRRTSRRHPTRSSSAQGGGIYANSGNAAGGEHAADRPDRASRTTRSTGGDTQQGAGIYTTGMDLRLLNSTIGANDAPLAGADGGGVFVDQHESVEPPTGSALDRVHDLQRQRGGAGNDRRRRDLRLARRQRDLDPRFDHRRRRRRLHREPPAPISSPAATTSRTPSTRTAGSTRRPTRTSKPTSSSRPRTAARRSGCRSQAPATLPIALNYAFVDCLQLRRRTSSRPGSASRAGRS